MIIVKKTYYRLRLKYYLVIWALYAPFAALRQGSFLGPFQSRDSPYVLLQVQRLSLGCSIHRELNAIYNLEYSLDLSHAGRVASLFVTRAIGGMLARIGEAKNADTLPLSNLSNPWYTPARAALTAREIRDFVALGFALLSSGSIDYAMVSSMLLPS